MFNIYKNSQDKKVRQKAVGRFVGLTCLYAMLMGYCIAVCIGFGEFGLIDSAPGLCALIIFGISFVFTVFKTNGYLFNFKEYDMLMSLPFESETVAACKFLYMYVKSLPWYVSISVAMLVGYVIYVHPAAWVYPVWILLSLIIPIIPMLIASFIGFLIARVSSGFKKTNIIQTVLTFIFVIFCFSLRFIVEGMIRNDKVQSTLEETVKASEKTGSVVLPIGWFANVVTKGDLLSGLLLIAVTAILFALTYTIVGRSYRSINSALKSHAASRNYKMTGQKQRSAVASIAFKELRRFLGSTLYMVNCGMGEVLAVLFGLLTLIIGFDRIIELITQGAPLDSAMLRPAIPFIVYFFIGMVATTVCSPSLEGKNYWIVDSLPISKKELYSGKMLFNMILSVPAMLFSTICLCISSKAPFVDTVLYIILGVALCAFSTAWGCVCGVKHIKLQWENEVEVIKQGSAVVIYLFPNMFVAMGLVVLAVYLGTVTDQRIITLIMTLAAGTLAYLSYRKVCR